MRNKIFEPNVSYAPGRKGEGYYYPLHENAKHLCFGITDVSDGVEIAAAEANLADAMARVGEYGELTNNDIMHLVPFVLRMLKSKSEWAK